MTIDDHQIVDFYSFLLSPVISRRVHTAIEIFPAFENASVGLSIVKSPICSLLFSLNAQSNARRKTLLQPKFRCNCSAAPEGQSHLRFFNRRKASLTRSINVASVENRNSRLSLVAPYPAEAILNLSFNTRSAS